MVMYIPKSEAMAALPYISDVELYKAVSLALWLILDKGMPLKYGVDTASRKHNVKPKIAIERLIRIAIPEEFFWSRMGSARPAPARTNIGTSDKNAANRAAKMKKIEKEAKRHIRDISNKQ